MQQTNSPVIIFVKPKIILVQEIKIIPSKSKITDLVALRHSPSSEARTTLILLCEDGSLKIFTANSGITDCWLRGAESDLALPADSHSSITALRPARKKKPPKPGSSRTLGLSSFPIDFFEQCTLISDVEFGGSDLLQVYNVQQLKNRLNSQSTYVACSKRGGFTMEITNKDAFSVICGVRVAVGGLDSQKIPSFIEVFGRNIPVATTRSRWYDIPLSREETLQSDKKLVLTFGPPTDSHVTIVDTVKVYGKTKEDFGWPDETEDYTGSASAPASTANANSTSVPAIPAANTTSSSRSSYDSDTTSATVNGNPTILESVFCSALDTLDGCFSTMPTANYPHKQKAMEIVTKMLNMQVLVFQRLNICIVFRYCLLFLILVQKYYIVLLIIYAVVMLVN